MVKKQAVFQYKTNKSLLHKCPAIVKFILLLPLSIIFMPLPFLQLLAGILILIIIAFLCRFTLREQLTDFKPAVFYSVLIYSLSVFSNLFIVFFHRPPFPLDVLLLFIFMPQEEFLRIAFRLILIIQLSALFFRTTSSIEIRESLNSIERFIRKVLSKIPLIGKRISHNAVFAENITIFLSFIPELFSMWSKINLAWKSRGGKNGIKKIKMLVFVLITCTFEKAQLKSKALQARSML